MSLITIADRYVLRQIARPLAAAMVIGMLVLLAERMVRLLDTTLGKKNSFAVVFELLAYLMPHYLGLAIPAALFLGLLFGFNKMSQDSEIDAFGAAGVGLARLARPVIGLSLSIALASFFIIGWAQPYTRYEYRSRIFDVTNVDVFYLAEEGVFMQAGTRTFILDELDRGENAFRHVFLFDYRGKGGSDTVTAARGLLIEVPGERRPVLRLEDGRTLKIDGWSDPRGAEPPVTATASRFTTADTPLGKVAEDAFRPRGDDERELSLTELFTKRDAPPAGASPQTMRAELHKRLVNILTPVLLPFLAIPFAIAPRRSRRAYRIGVALIILIGLHETVEQGAIAAKAGSANPWLAIWLPFVAVAVFAFWRFRAACFVLAPDRLEPVLERVAQVVDRVRLGVMSWFGWRPA
jgi:lipopolysaccharide export system permease protein